MSTTQNGRWADAIAPDLKRTRPSRVMRMARARSACTQTPAATSTTAFGHQNDEDWFSFSHEEDPIVVSRLLQPPKLEGGTVVTEDSDDEVQDVGGGGERGDERRAAALL